MVKMKVYLPIWGLFQIFSFLNFLNVLKKPDIIVTESYLLSLFDDKNFV